MILDIYQYSCGSKFEELKVTDSDRAPRVNALLEKVFVWEILFVTVIWRSPISALRVSLLYAISVHQKMN